MRLNLPMLLATLLLFAIEVVIATQLNHAFFIRAYFGDFLVVILVYCAIAACFQIETQRLALGVFIFACSIELAQLFKLADLLKLTGTARIILGTSFSWVDILMYALGCLSIYGIALATK